MSAAKKDTKTDRYVLDTTAILAYSGNEPGADLIEELLFKAHRKQLKLYISFMTVMEAGYKAFRARGKDGLVKMMAYLQELPLHRIDVNEELLSLAAQIKGGGSLSAADAWILATAKYLDATLVHRDPEFEQARTDVHLQELPRR